MWHMAGVMYIIVDGGELVVLGVHACDAQQQLVSSRALLDHIMS